MKIINYYNFDVNLLNKYNRYFLLGEISLINDMEESIIQYFNTNNFIKIYRGDLNLKLNVDELKKNILVKDLFSSTNLIILRAEEIWLHSAMLQKSILLVNQLIPLNYFLIVKTHILKNKDIDTNLFMDEFLTIKPLIINCKIDNDFNSVNSWLKTKSFKLSPIIYKYLYSCYENDVYKLSNFFKNLSFKASTRLRDLNKILFRHDRSFTILHLLKYLSQGDLDILWDKLFFLKEDKLLSIFYELKNFIIILTKRLLYKKKDNHYNLKKIIQMINLKKLYYIIKLVNNLEVDLTNRSSKEKLIYDQIINIILIIIIGDNPLW